MTNETDRRSNPGQAFLWLLKKAGDQQAGQVTRLLLAEPTRRWSDIVEKNLAKYLKYSTD